MGCEKVCSLFIERVMEETKWRNIERRVRAKVGIEKDMRIVKNWKKRVL